jgi:hypothetical protein
MFAILLEDLFLFCGRNFAVEGEDCEYVFVEFRWEDSD